jgi:prolyl-tRNA editing enzyme YbaK/EbsC (Cys-tRNA(Pro) deacylase)
LPHDLCYVQYTARLNADKLKNIIHKLNGGRIGKQYFNMRLCPEDVSDGLSGYEHNAVSPIGIKTPLPIILSHRCACIVVDALTFGAS